MLQFLIYLICLTSIPNLAFPRFSAASLGQIQFAYENKFDNTGPGAKEPDHAYKTYQNLDDALISYANDEDTKLPEHEKARAIANLYKIQNSRNYYNVANAPKRVDPLIDNRPTIWNNYADFKPKVFGRIHPSHENVVKNNLSWQKEYQPKATRVDIDGLSPRQYDGVQYLPLLKEQQPKMIKVAVDSISPIQYDQVQYWYVPHPDVEFSVDVHDKETGDLKSAQELQDGSGTIHGYYTIMKSNGQRRTVHYQSDPFRRYKSAVKKVF